MVKNSRNNLKKKNIVENISSNIGISSFYSAKIVNDIIHILTSQLLLYNKLKIKNFGSFSLRKKNKRIGINPQTKEKHNISERIVALFKTSDSLKIRINKNVKR